MKVAIVALGPVSRDTGGRTYLTEILGPLGDRPGMEVEVHLSDRRLPIPSNCRVVWHKVPERVGAIGRIVAEAGVAAALAKGRCDVLLAPFNFLPVTWTGPSVVVQHNVLVVGQRLRLEVTPLRAWYRPRAAASALRRATKTIAVSAYLRRLLLENFPTVDPARIHVVPCGVSRHLAIAAETREESSHGRRVLVVSSLWPYKRVDESIRAFADVAKDVPDLTLQIAGPGNQSEHRYLLDLTRELDVADRVHFLGNVSHKRLAHLYATAYALLFASEVEASGLPVLEAMMCGVPVIARRVGGVPEIGGDGPLWVDEHARFQAIANALRLVLSNEDLRMQRIDAGRRHAKMFTWERTAELTADVIGTAFAARGHRSHCRGSFGGGGRRDA